MSVDSVKSLPTGVKPMAIFRDLDDLLASQAGVAENGDREGIRSIPAHQGGAILCIESMADDHAIVPPFLGVGISPGGKREKFDEGLGLAGVGNGRRSWLAGPVKIEEVGAEGNVTLYQGGRLARLGRDLESE